MKQSYLLTESVLVLVITVITLFISVGNFEATPLARGYASIFQNSSSPQDHLSSSSFSTSKSDVDFKLNNTTGIVSLVGNVNVNSLQGHKFKPFVFSGSTACFLTEDYVAYKAAKNASEALRPATKVLQIHVPSSSSTAGIFNESRFNHARSSSSSPFIVQFKGLEQNCCVPPDVHLAAGPTYVIEMVNLEGTIYTKSGSIVKEFSLEQFFNPNKIGTLSSNIDSGMSDPILTYDSQSGRWFASISDTTEHSIRVAVSHTGDPTGIWEIYNFPFGFQPDNCSDQPFIGVSKDKIVITANNWADNCNWYSDNHPQN